MGEIFIMYGPPGVGKTTRLATRDIPRAIDKYGPDKVLVTSFSRAAAREIASKKSRTTGQSIDVNPEHVGTTHSLCYHLLGMPTMVHEGIDHWNEKFPQYYISKSSLGDLSGDSLTEGRGEKDGEALLNRADIYRAKMTPMEYWDLDVAIFFNQWTAFKEDKGLMDFTDLIEVALKTKPFGPGHPSVIFVDEAQDFTNLQIKLIESWGQMADWVVFTGDDDQCIYSFTGCDPVNMIRPSIPDDRKIVLPQSYRVPRAIQKKSLEIISNVNFRYPKEYDPRDFNGSCSTIDASYYSPHNIITEAEEKIKEGKTVMILASCDYMLNQVKKLLRESALPFHNPYRVKRGNWNPLRTASRGVSSKDLLISFLDKGTDEAFWNVPQFIRWAQYLKVGENGLKRKVGNKIIKKLKVAVEENAEGLHTCREFLADVLSPAAIDQALNRNPLWLQENLKSMRASGIDYPVKIFKHHGYDVLNEQPKITIGTIHSVKGGEADVVYIFPDISTAAYNSMYNDQDSHDSLYRLFYVGCTRAKEELHIAKAGSRYTLEF